MFKIEIQKGEQIIQLVCRIGYPQEIRPPVFSLRKFSKTDKNQTECIEI